MCTPTRIQNVSLTTVSQQVPHVVSCSDLAWRKIREYQRQSLTVGLVPTMGALHAGHESLIREAHRKCDRVAVTIFVNPTQFGPAEDLAQYPRPREQDLRLMEELQVDLVFMPREQEIYPPGFSTFVEPPNVSHCLEGEFRPGHFRGVATIVLKLFQIIPADWAFFGQKDYQQCLVIRDLVHDLNVPIQLEFCPTIREADGLALSSRNQYLTDSERQRALGLSRALQGTRRLFQAGIRDRDTLEREARQTLTQAGIDRIDYAAVRDPNTLEERSVFGDEAIMLIAARVGRTRLIDNLRLD